MHMPYRVIVLLGVFMELYKVIFADDEQVVRQAVLNCVNWEECGFTVVGDASHGEEALELSEKLKPDLVITDIKMPHMDGLELCKNLKMLLPTVKTVILTGFDDFEYAKQAISLNVLEYVLKPVNSHEFMQILKKVKKTMDEEAEKRRDIERLTEHYRLSLPILREHFLIGLLEGCLQGEIVINSLKRYDLNLNSNYYTACVMRCDGQLENDSEANIRQFAVSRIADEVLNKLTYAYVFIYNDYIMAVISLHSKLQIQHLMMALNEVSVLGKKYQQMTVSVGIGYLVDNLDNLSMAYKGALIALDYRFMQGAGKSIYIADIEPNTTIPASLSPIDEQRLIRAIRLADTNEIEKTINNQFSRFESVNLPYSQYEFYIVDMIITILRIAGSFSLGSDDIFGANFDIISTIKKMESAEKLKIWFNETCLKVSEYIGNVRQNATNILIENAKNYALNNISDCEFSVEKMCNELHVSPSYFSSLFKKTEGISFVNWLTDVKMNEAIKLLLNTNDKTYFIALKLGFEDPNYFSFVFKKKFGISPSKYRSGLFENE